MAATILYIEDNEHNMRLVRKILQHAGYTLIEATNGLTGLGAAVEYKPDLILMDMNLPDIDGIEATKRIKEIPELADVPIIALTANVMHGDRERFIASGCDEYVPKPITRTELLHTIQLFLAQFASV